MLPYFVIIKTFLKNFGWVAEWSALQTGNRGDPRSIPGEVKTFFGGNQLNLKKNEVRPPYLITHMHLSFQLSCNYTFFVIFKIELCIISKRLIVRFEC